MPPSTGAASVSAQPSSPSADQQALQALLAACRATYVPLNESPASAAGKGGWYYTPCAKGLGMPANGVGPLSFIPASAAVPAVPAIVLALRARRELVLPVPSISSSPGSAAGVPKVVNLPTWAWIGGGVWAPVTATAAVPGTSVTATATPRYVAWSWGDGAASVCRGPGAVYRAGVSDPAAASPDCGHTYARTSKNAPGLRFRVSATIHWQITWRATTGQAGRFPDMTSTAAQAWPVEEIDALNIPGNQPS